MSILEVEEMSQGFGDKVIFNRVSFRLLAGEHIGLVGANGQGKTTFMKLITKELLPDEGFITWSSKVTVGYMDQNVDLSHYSSVRQVLESSFIHLYQMEDKMNELYDQSQQCSGDDLDKLINQAARIQEELEKREFYSINSKVEGVATGLGVYGYINQNPQKLSGGQRTKVLLAKLLLEEPDVLLLDEPTNHLDEENIIWLKQYLINYKKAFILISHDVHFMNTVINVVYYLKNKSLSRYPGNYEKFLLLYKEKEKALISQYAKQQVTIKKLETYIAKNKVRASTAVQAKSREKQLNKMERIQLDKRLPIPKFNFKYAIDPTQKIITAKNLVIGYHSPLTKALNLEIERNDKIVLTGANGIGKTTLLKSLLAMNQPLEGEIQLGDHLHIGYYEQEPKHLSEEVVLDYVWSQFPDAIMPEVRTMLARCGLLTEHIQNRFSSLSGGEQAKVRLCCIINKKSNVLFLDEPTNHLDKEAKKQLKEALIQYPGTIVLVSHEKEFYQGLVNKVWDCRKFKVENE